MVLEKLFYIVFDLNGTLVVENYLRHDEVLEDILKCRKKNRGLTSKDLRAVSKGKLPLSEVIRRLYEVDDPEAISQQFFAVQASRITFREKAFDVLEALRNKYRLILCSDTTGIAKEVVKNLGLSKYFLRIFYSCDVGYLKSEAKFWINLLAQFSQATSQHFLVIGDNPRADTYHPNQLGMHTVLIENPIQPPFDYRDQPTGSYKERPEYHIKSLGEILKILGLVTAKT